MKSSEYNYGLYQNQVTTKEPCHKRALNGINNTFNKVKLFSKEKPIILGLICLSVLTILIIIIIIVSISGGKDKKENGNKSNDICSNKYSDECLYTKMIAKKTEYPEGMKWDNSDKYCWKGGVYGCGLGCAGFAFMLSDVCFDEIKAQNLDPCPGDFKVGDVVRINNDSHYIIILKIDKTQNTIIVAEGNYNYSIHWERTFTVPALKNTCNHILRRNPN